MNEPNETTRYSVVREPQAYSVIDKHRPEMDRRVREFKGKTAKERAWALARKLNREPDEHPHPADAEYAQDYDPHDPDTTDWW